MKEKSITHDAQLLGQPIEDPLLSKLEQNLFLFEEEFPSGKFVSQTLSPLGMETEK